MPDLIELLESFNRKERFFLISQALGNFQMSDHFRRELGKTVSIEIPAGSFTAMDYHLDWLTAALVAHGAGNKGELFDNPGQQTIHGTQEDIDLLVAFRAESLYHIILVEAKGDTGWTNKQMRSKANRLTQIFGLNGGKYADVHPHICLTSPKKPSQRLKDGEWPAWMRKGGNSFNWLELNFPGNRRIVTRCDADRNPSAQGQYFRITTSQETR